MPLSVDDKLGRYEVSLPARAGLGEVYKARDPRLNRTVAIKVSKTAFGECFEREVQAIAQPESSAHLPDLRRRAGLLGHGVHRGQTYIRPSASWKRR